MSGRISEDPDAGVLTGTELIPVVSNGMNMRTTPEQLARFIGGGGGGTTFSARWSPANLGNALVAWYDFSNSGSVSAGSGGVITSTSDLSNNQYTLISAGSPTYGKINGYGAASFDGTTGYCLVNPAMLLPQIFTVVCLFQVGAAINPTSEELWGGDVNASAPRAIFFINNYAGVPVIYAGAGNAQVGPTLNTNTVYLSTVVMKGGSSQYSYNGAPLTQVPSNPGYLGMTNGFRISGNNGFEGLVGFLAIIDGELTTSDLQKLQGYAANQFGLSTSLLSPGHPYYGTALGPLTADPNVPVQILSQPIGTMVLLAGTAGTSFNYSRNFDGTLGFNSYTNANLLQQTVYFPYSGEYSFTIPCWYFNYVPPSQVGNSLEVLVGQTKMATQGAGPGNYYTHLVTNTYPSQNYTFTGFVAAGFHSILIRTGYAQTNSYYVSQGYHMDRLIISTTGTPIPAEPPGNRNASLYPMSSNSLWNQPIGSGAIWSNASDTDTLEITGAYGQLNIAYFGAPIYVGQSSDPIATWQDLDTVQICDVTSPGPVRVVAHAPAGMTHSTDGVDDNMAFLDGTAPRYAYVGFVTTVSAGPPQAVASSGVYLDTLEVNPCMLQATNEYTGVIRGIEIQNMSFQHQVSVGLATNMVSRGTTTTTGLAWPAGESDGVGASYTGPVLYGAKMGVPSGTPMPGGMSAVGQAFWQCMMNYGCICNITGGQPAQQITFYTGPDAPSGLASQLQTDLQAIVPHLRILRNHTPSTPNGGGTPLVPLLPGLQRPLPRATWMQCIHPQDNGGLTISNGNFTATQPLTSAYTIVRTTPAVYTRQIYMEFLVVVTDNPNGSVGLAQQAETLSATYLGYTTNSVGFFFNGGYYYNAASQGTWTSTAVANGDTICLAIDGTNDKVWARHNNGNWMNDVLANQNPAGNVGGFGASQYFGASTSFPAIQLYSNGAQVSLVRPANQLYTAPAGFMPT